MGLPIRGTVLRSLDVGLIEGPGGPGYQLYTLFVRDGVIEAFLIRLTECVLPVVVVADAECWFTLMWLAPPRLHLLEL